jgi:DNA-binding GntR family transcriptional regulator
MPATGPSKKKGRPTSRDYVAEELRRGIVRGEFEPGEKLNPMELAEHFGVSQTPAREAIQLLATEGLVRNDSFRGARVADLTAEEYEELYLMRVGLEQLAARLGAEAITDDGIAEMDRLFEEMAAAVKSGDIDLFYERDREFHLAHYGASGRESLVKLIMGLRVSSERYARAAYTLPNVSMKDTLSTHADLLDTVRARDGVRCAEVIEQDLRRTLDTFVEQFGKDGAIPVGGRG